MTRNETEREKARSCAPNLRLSGARRETRRRRSGVCGEAASGQLGGGAVGGTGAVGSGGTGVGEGTIKSSERSSSRPLRRLGAPREKKRSFFSQHNQDAVSLSLSLGAETIPGRKETPLERERDVTRLL